MEYKISKNNTIVEVDDWRVELINFAPNVFSTSSCLNVTLLLILRYLGEFKGQHIDNLRKISYWSIVTIWPSSIVVNIIAVLAQNFGSPTWTFYFYYRYFRLHVFTTLPILCIIFMYIKFHLRLKQKKDEALAMTQRMSIIPTNEDLMKKEIETKAQEMSKTIQIVVLFLVVCFVPYIVWLQYYYMEFPSRTGDDYTTKGFEVYIFLSV